jgi:4-nitrophenyl phosphatase
MSVHSPPAHAGPRRERVDVRDLRALLLDMDGVVYRGDAVLPGARDLLEFMRVRGIPHVFLTNNSSLTPRHYADKLLRMGIRTTPDRILTSALVAVQDLRRSAGPDDRVLLLGGAGVREALAVSGLTLADHYREATVVLVGLDRALTYEKLAQAALAIGRGARFLATNGDRSYPSERGLEPGAGALVAALQTTTGVAPKMYGKPEPEMFAQALELLGTPPELTGMVGDRYETDVLGAARCGLVTIAVTTGVSSEAELRAADPAPDWIFPSLVELRAAMNG